MSIAIFNRKMGMKLEIVAEGKLTADGSEQNVVFCSEIAILSGYISMSKMGGGDIIAVKQYIMVNGSEELYAQDAYSGPQVELLHFQRRAFKDATRITLQQTAGSYKTFDYEFGKEVN